MIELREWRGRADLDRDYVDVRTFPTRHVRQAAQAYSDLCESARRSGLRAGVEVWVDGAHCLAYIDEDGRLVWAPIRDESKIADPLFMDEWESSMRAYLIGESSAGMTAVEIYTRDGDLIWSHRWFEARGAGTAEYIAGLCQALDCMRQCADWRMFGEGAKDENGDPVYMDDSSTTGIILEYDSEEGKWSLFGEARRMGQSEEIVDALMLAGLLEPDEAHEDRSGNEIVVAIARHIMEVLK